MAILLDRTCAMLDGNCDCPRQEGKAFPECQKYPKKNPCIKGMTVDTCRYNPRLGCDCGAIKPHAPVKYNSRDYPL